MTFSSKLYRNGIYLVKVLLLPIYVLATCILCLYCSVARVWR